MIETFDCTSNADQNIKLGKRGNTFYGSWQCWLWQRLEATPTALTNLWLE